MSSKNPLRIEDDALKPALGHGPRHRHQRDDTDAFEVVRDEALERTRHTRLGTDPDVPGGEHMPHGDELRPLGEGTHPPTGETEGQDDVEQQATLQEVHPRRRRRIRLALPWRRRR